MSRKNESVEGIFTKMHNSYYDVIKRRSIESTKETRDLEDTYHSHLERLAHDVELVAQLEQLVLQRRVYDNPKDIKLGIQDDYIFAMCPFYRGDKRANDIRAYVGKTAVLGTDLSALYSDAQFMAKAQDMLKQQMHKIITRSTEDYLRTI